MSAAMMSAPTPSARRVPKDLAGWVNRWRDAEIPVLQHSAAELEQWRDHEDVADARLLSETFSADPLMCLKLLVHAAKLRSNRRTADAETMLEALVLMGISPFFREFGQQPVVEQLMAERPVAQDGLAAVLMRSRRAARFALGFAVHRMDHDAAVIHEAALLHDFTEMLLWVHEPELAEQMAQRQREEPGLRSAAVQRELLGVTLGEVQQALMKAWRLPALLVRITDDQHAHSAQVRNVLLAIRLARHTALSWDNPAVPDDVADIAQLLTLGEGPTRTLLTDLDS
ncbi:HDOD domain-containing protein [Burkholderiales bacterium JOSHI_001]|nr:HDOD domain-containing protein [Burkholderiales bacterium JOSHI_001]